MEELEIIPQGQLQGIRFFINRVEYRCAHFHSEWELIWVLESPLLVTFSQKQHLIQPGEWLLLSPNCPHEFRHMEQPCTFLCLQISPKVFPATAQLRTDAILLRPYLSAADALWLQQTVVQTAQAYWEQQPFSELYCLGQCSLVLHRLLRCLPFHRMSAEEVTHTEQRNARLIRLVQFVDENYMHKIRLADFAEKEGCSVSYLSHFVRDAMNQTFQEYVNSVRFNCARQLMATTAMSLGNICYESGFSDYRYFSQAFQNAYGMTPAQYRQQAQSLPAEDVLPPGSLHSREEIFSRSKSLAWLSRLAQKWD